MLGIVVMMAYLLVIIILCFVQYILSTLKNKWLGLILPITNFCFVILYMAVTAVGALSGSTLELIEGELILVLYSFLMIFVTFNLPTIAFIIIYEVGRSKVKKRNVK